MNGKRVSVSRTAHILNNMKADEITSDVWKKQWKEVDWKPPSLPCWQQLHSKTSITRRGQQGNCWSRTKAVKSRPRENKRAFKHEPLQVCIYGAVLNRAFSARKHRGPPVLAGAQWKAPQGDGQCQQGAQGRRLALHLSTTTKQGKKV